ncbi:hypothetical protein N7522_001324 [Penicillium canescens]|nr:hypothetical protein N7522_001324 [Penicillium canescens]
MCCSLNSTTPDTCHPNGLCLSSADSKYGSNYWRDFCTDETWNSPNCLSKTICDKSAGGSSSWTARLTICDGGAYCCGTDKSCCLEGTTFTLAATLVNIGNHTTATAIVTATVTSKVSGSSKVAIGAGVGVPLAVLALAMLGAGFLWGRKKAQAKLNALDAAHADLKAEEDMRSGIKQADPRPLYEVSGLISPITTTRLTTFHPAH